MNIKNIAKAMLLVACVSFASCNNDEDGSDSVQFPELTTIEDNAGSVTSVQFDAPQAWTITSSAIWCKFVVDSTEYASYSGAAGEQNLMIKITDDALNVIKSDTANVTLKMGAQEKVIFSVVRVCEGYKLAVLNMNDTAYNESTPLTLIYENEITFKVKANCSWTLMSAPDWMEAKYKDFNKNNVNAALCGNAGEEVLAVAKVKDEFKYLPQADTLFFVNEDSSLKVAIPVVYDGISSTEIDFSLRPNQRYHWAFSADGFTVSTNPDMGSVEIEDTPKMIEVYAKNNEFEYIRLEKTDWGYAELNSWSEWFYVTKFGGNKINITVDKNNGNAARSGCVMVFPKEVYDNITNIDSLFINDFMDINPIYEKYMAFDFNQEAATAAALGFTVKNMGYLDIPSDYIMNMADQMDETTLEGMFGTSNVWMLATETPYASLAITPTGLGVDYFEITSEFNGVDTKFDSVEFEPMGDSFMIYGLDTAATGEMKITITNGYTGAIVGVLIVATYF